MLLYIEYQVKGTARLPRQEPEMKPQLLFSGLKVRHESVMLHHCAFEQIDLK